MNFIIIDTSQKSVNPVIVKYVNTIDEGKDWIIANTKWGHEPNKYRIKRNPTL